MDDIPVKLIAIVFCNLEDFEVSSFPQIEFYSSR